MSIIKDAVTPFCLQWGITLIFKIWTFFLFLFLISKFLLYMGEKLVGERVRMELSIYQFHERNKLSSSMVNLSSLSLLLRSILSQVDSFPLLVF